MIFETRIGTHNRWRRWALAFALSAWFIEAVCERAGACEPLPDLGNCGAEEKAPLRADYLRRLSASIGHFDAQLRQAVRRHAPAKFSSVGSGDCFLMNGAKDLLSDLEPVAAKNGRACRAVLELLRSEADKLLDPESEELRAVRSREARDQLEGLRRKAKADVSEFMDIHLNNRGKRR